jgi:hypothetical protein
MSELVFTNMKQLEMEADLKRARELMALMMEAFDTCPELMSIFPVAQFLELDTGKIVSVDLLGSIKEYTVEQQEKYGHRPSTH